ncbi:MAG: GGDEF domain-containing protein [Coprobacillus sp.]
MKKNLLDRIVILNSKQKEGFYNYIPNKVYKTERNIAIIVALTQLFMMSIFIINKRVSFEMTRSMQYFCLYLFLFVFTMIAIIAYTYTHKHKNDTVFLWVRRIYAVVLCLWVLGITFLEQMNGNGISVYYYLIPTMAAVLLLTPIESVVFFGLTWVALIILLMNNTTTRSVFGDIINGTFVTILTLYISYRYYHSMAIEFCDRETIASQYKEIEVSNTLLKKMVHIDQLTNFYNRHYLFEKIYPLFDECKKKKYDCMFLMIDIDYFKQYNDYYGHIQGDECLKRLALEIRHVCHEFDADPIRYGGEEFLVVKMSDEVIDTHYFANKLLKTIQDMDIHRDDVEFDRVTVSIGTWSGKISELKDIDEGIKEADNALYEAKSLGRNCLVEKNC